MQLNSLFSVSSAIGDSTRSSVTSLSTPAAPKRTRKRGIELQYDTESSESSSSRKRSHQTLMINRNPFELLQAAVKEHLNTVEKAIQLLELEYQD